MRKTPPGQHLGPRCNCVSVACLLQVTLYRAIVLPIERPQWLTTCTGKGNMQGCFFTMKKDTDVQDCTYTRPSNRLSATRLLNTPAFTWTHTLTHTHALLIGVSPLNESLSLSPHGLTLALCEAVSRHVLVLELRCLNVIGSKIKYRVRWKCDYCDNNRVYIGGIYSFAHFKPWSLANKNQRGI